MLRIQNTTNVGVQCCGEIIPPRKAIYRAEEIYETWLGITDWNKEIAERSLDVSAVDAGDAAAIAGEDGGGTGAGGDGGATASGASAPKLSEDEQRIADIDAGYAKVGPNDLTDAGIPSVVAMSRIVGFRVTGAERDAAVKRAEAAEAQSQAASDDGPDAE